ncbi:DUF6509 family protein [Bacillus thermotolerans]|uniref:Pullulanase n=1 Tax=Bacillus thermotolerans TaxID=1221996 RepID=A0A0F5HKP1_BACTR|nr:DUF6509 family protein [Bacillus thermotolerans]KKB33823.1 hypothetical protein QY97_02972 [Bacillus thermotolerans]KKB37317.1 hypothetical protein QY95_02868 [Bacillus thermotolerans]KKB42137.1 hypothetical protein QY96_01514 [Bacillus thermotolerans]
MEITHHTVEKLEDPFGLLEGDRYEFHLYANVDEEDDLYSEAGFLVRVLYLADKEEEKILHYEIRERETGNVLDFELEEEEEELIAAYCQAHKEETTEENE